MAGFETWRRGTRDEGPTPASGHNDWKGGRAFGAFGRGEKGAQGHEDASTQGKVGQKGMRTGFAPTDAAANAGAGPSREGDDERDKAGYGAAGRASTDPGPGGAIGLGERAEENHKHLDVVAHTAGGFDLDPQSLGLVCDLLDGGDLTEVMRVSRLWRAAALDVGVSFWRELDVESYGLMAPYGPGGRQGQGQAQAKAAGRGHAMCYCTVRRVLSGRRAAHLKTLDLRMCIRCAESQDKLFESLTTSGELDAVWDHKPGDALDEDDGNGCCLGPVGKDPERELAVHMAAMMRAGRPREGGALVPVGIAIAGCSQLENLCVDGCAFPPRRGCTGLYLTPLKMLTTVNLSRTGVGDVELLLAFGYRLTDSGVGVQLASDHSGGGAYAGGTRDEDDDSDESDDSDNSDDEVSEEEGRQESEASQNADVETPRVNSRRGRPVLEAKGTPLPCLKYLNLAHGSISGRFVQVDGRYRMSLEVLLGDAVPALEELVLTGNPVAEDGSRWSRHGQRMARAISTRKLPLRVNMLDELKLPASLKLFCGYCHQVLFEDVTGYLKRVGSQPHIAVEIHTDHRPLSGGCASYMAASAPGDPLESAQTLNCASNCHDRMDLYLVDCGTGAVDLWGYRAGVACSESVCLGGKNPRMKFFRLWRCPTCKKENQTTQTTCLSTHCKTEGPALTLALGETGAGRPTVRRWIFDSAQPHMFVASPDADIGGARASSSSGDAGAGTSGTVGPALSALSLR